MSDSKSRPHGTGSSSKASAAKDKGASLSSSGKSGRVAFDSRGNPVWEWQTSTGVYDRNVSTQRLKKLQAEELSIADTQATKKPKGLALEEPTQLPGGGVNPYNSGAVARSESRHLPKSHHGHSHSMTPHKQGQSAAKRPAPSKPQGTWQRLKSKLLRDK